MKILWFLMLALAARASECTNIDVTDFGAIGDGATDSTAAIQAAFNAALSNSTQSATVTFRPGLTYCYEHLVIPPSPAFPSGSQTLRLASSILPGQSLSVVDANTAHFGGTVLKCTATNGTAISAALPDGGFNAVTVDLENLAFLFPDNPQVIGLNFRKAYGLRARGVTVYTGRSPYSVVQPTASGSIGLCTPTNNNAAFTSLTDTAVIGFYTGLELSEHTTGDNVSAWACAQGFTFPFAFHASHLDRLMTVHCGKGIVFTGAARVVIDEYDTERLVSGWNATTDDVSDPSSLGSANITWAAITANVGVSHTFTLSGSGIQAREIGGTFAAPPAVIAPSLPLVQTGLYASYDAQCVVTSSTNRWVDQWTNALHLTASTGAGSVPNDVGGYTSLSFTGTSGGPWYSNEAYSVNQPNEIFVVARVTGNFTDYGAIIDSTSNTAGTRQALAYYVSSGAISFYAGAEVIGPAIPSGAWAVFDMVFNGSSSVLYVNGTQVAAGNVGANSGRGLLVGGIPGYGPKTLMRVARIDAYSGVLDSVSRSNQLNWMATRYGISH